jgi:thiamine-phosphate pyrophosphorylase
LRSAAEVQALPIGSVDYASIGGVFATASKDNPDPPIGREGFSRLLRLLGPRMPGLPVCAIAGIDHRNAREVVGAGAHGVAVISDIFMADDVAASTHRLRTVVDAALRERNQT